MDRRYERSLASNAETCGRLVVSVCENEFAVAGEYAPMTVSITFESPDREQAQRPASLHERCLEAVPPEQAEQMARDFVEYRSEKKGERRKLYRYESVDGECLVALDFEEIVAIMAEGTNSTPEQAERLGA